MSSEVLLANGAELIRVSANPLRLRDRAPGYAPPFAACPEGVPRLSFKMQALSRKTVSAPNKIAITKACRLLWYIVFSIVVLTLSRILATGAISPKRALSQ